MDQDHSTSLISRIYGNLNIAQWVAITALISIVLMSLAAWSTAGNSRELMRQETLAGLKAQSEAIASLLSLQAGEDLQKIQNLMNSMRWNADKSGYGFIINTQGELIAYPPKPERVGNKVSTEGLAEKAAEVARTKQPDILVYEFQKPNQNVVSEKVTYLMPIDGTPWILAIGSYLDNANKSYQQAMLSSVYGVLAVIGLIGLNTYVFSRYLKHRINSLTLNLESIANKNFSFKVELYGRDEISLLNKYLEQTRQGLNKLCLHQENCAGNLASSSSSLDQSISKAAECINAELERLEMLATAMNEMAATVKDVAHSAAMASDATHASDKKAHHGEMRIDETTQSISELCVMLEESSASVNNVELKVEEIGTVIDTINSISEQTNLLALNAAIEAARAGEQGRGFAVVADEVRQLASRTQESTKEIEATIDSLTSSARQAVSLMSKSVEKANEGGTFANHAGEEFKAIVEDISQLSDRSTQIATAAEEQTAVAAEMSKNIEEIRESVTDTDQMIVSISKASSELKREADGLNNQLSDFTLSKAVHQ